MPQQTERVKSRNLTKLIDAHGQEKRIVAAAIGCTDGTINRALREGEWSKPYEIACEALLRRLGQGSKRKEQTFVVTLPRDKTEPALKVLEAFEAHVVELHLN